MSVIGRLWRHVWRGRQEMRRAFPAAARSCIEAAVSASERRHRGEVRVVIESGVGWRALHGEPESRALAWAQFARQGVWDTAENTGVLIYMLMAGHRFEIIADRGLTRCVASSAWQEIVRAATARCAEGEYLDGVLLAIAQTDALLAQHFPAHADANPDELPDAPVLL